VHVAHFTTGKEALTIPKSDILPLYNEEVQTQQPRTLKFSLLYLCMRSPGGASRLQIAGVLLPKSGGAFLADANFGHLVDDAQWIHLEGESQRKLRAQGSIPNT
jgi:hypothetical protein